MNLWEVVQNGDRMLQSQQLRNQTRAYEAATTGNKYTHVTSQIRRNRLISIGFIHPSQTGSAAN